ncbi:hypothetical protein J1N35_022381 [Gossypium stocksii]|uniref:Uncharacterized protein n=1 Tax=Gossypium stocksii TaxID=47602 RepID=A0A9D3VGD9_9ROSI|nr:hypothetical protein J1N35_022381 [Gossypium stocksii]
MASIREATEALNWEVFCEKRPSADQELVHEFYANLTSSKLIEVSVQGIKGMVLFHLVQTYAYFTWDHNFIRVNGLVILNLTAKTIDMGKIILREIQNCAARCSRPAYFPFTITILCLKVKIIPKLKKIGYSQGTITDWDLYQVAGDYIQQQRVELSENLEKEEEDPIEIKPIQSIEIPNKAKPIEPMIEFDMPTSTLRTHSPPLDLHDELSKLMDLMQHMQW